MPESVDMRCNACGQGMRIQLVDTYNRLPANHCPICGTPTLVRSKTHIITSPESRFHYYKVDAACFAGVNPELVALLYQNWLYRDKADDPDVELPARFVDYLKEQLEG